MKKAIWTIVVILFVAATLCACSSDKFPTGKYTNSGDLVEYKDDGTYYYMSNYVLMTEGTYSIQDDEIQFTDSYCAELDANPGTYKWQYEDGKLTFEKIEDICEGRIDAVALDWIGPK